MRPGWSKNFALVVALAPFFFCAQLFAQTTVPDTLGVRRIYNFRSPLSSNALPGQIRLFDPNSEAGDNYVGMRASYSMSANYILVLPKVGPTTGQVLLSANGDSLAFGSVPSGLTVREVDGSPSISGATVIEFENTNGFVITNPSGTIARVDLSSLVTRLGQTIESAEITDSTITDSDIAANAAISLSKMAAGTPAQVPVVNSSNVLTYRTFSGDATISSTGVITVADDSHSHSNYALNTVTLTAGAGMTGGGDLSANRTFDIVSATDDITVNANDIQFVPGNVALGEFAGTLGLAKGGSGADLSSTGGANQFVKQSSVGAALSVGAIGDADVPNTITLDNLTQITTRSHSDLQNLTTGDPHTQYVLKTVTLTAGDGLAGGGDLSSNRAFSVNLDFDGGLESVDDSLNVKLDGATLAKSSAGLKIASGGVSTTEIADGTITEDDLNSNIAGSGLVLTPGSPGTLDFAPSELSSVTFGNAGSSTATLSFSLSGATDPVLNFGNNLLNVTNAVLSVAGAAVYTTADGSFEEDDLSDNTLNDLSDVALSALAAGHVLIRNSGNTAFVNVAISGDGSLSTTGTLTVNDDSHSHTGATLSGIDISDDTNLSAASPITLTGDQIGFNQAANFDWSARHRFRDGDSDTLTVNPSGFSASNTLAAGTRALQLKDGASELFYVDTTGVLNAITLQENGNAITSNAEALGGDLSGNLPNPSVVDDSHAHTTSTISGLDAGADFSAGVLPIARGGLATGTAPSDGKIPIGKTDNTYAIANLTSGSNISIVNGDGTITISATGVGEVNTASNLGGGFWTFDSKSGVNLRFNTLSRADFDSLDNVLSIKDSKWAKDSELHNAVTLASDADVLLGLSTQQLTLDAQSANVVFAGPASGGAADPTFRALVDDDVPDNITITNLSGTNTGDVTLAGTPNYITISGQTITRNEVALTTHTSGNYVASVATTAPLSGGAAGSEGATLTLSIANDGINATQIDETAAYNFSSTSNQVRALLLHADTLKFSNNGGIKAVDDTLYYFKADGSLQFRLALGDAPNIGEVLKISAAKVATWEADAGGEVNTASNLGGGLANFDSKSGVDLRFNTFAAADFDLASNVISIDDTKWAKDSELHAAVTLAGESYLSLATQQITANPVNLSGSHVTGTLAAARFPALTGHVTTTAGNLATTIANSVITAAMIADGDHGAFTYSGGAATLDASSVSGGTGGIITDNTITAADIAADAVGASELLESDTYDFTGVVKFDFNALRIDDVDSTHQLIITPGSNLTANRTFTLTTGDADRTLTISGNTTLGGGSHSGTNTGDVTLAGALDYITRSGQELTLNAVDLAADVTGILPDANVSNDLTLGTVSGAIDAGGATSFEMPNGAAVTTDAFGEIAADNNAWATGRGAIQVYDGTANTFLIGALVSDPPSAGEVLKFNADGTFTFEADNTGGAPSWNSITAPTAATSFVSDGTSETFTLDFQSAFTTGSQFVLKQSTGNPSGGILTDIQTADADVIPLRVTGQGTSNGVQMNASGVLAPIGTGQIDANRFNGSSGALTDDDLSNNSIDDLSDVTITSAVAAHILVRNSGNTAWVNVALSGDGSIAATGALTVNDDSHAHTTSTISGLDISDDTNLSVAAPITLTGDQVGFNQSANFDWSARHRFRDADSDTLTINVAGFNATNSFNAGTRVLQYKDAGSELFYVDSTGTLNAITLLENGNAVTNNAEALGGDLSGNLPNPSVVDDSHNHTGATISGIDISDDTNLLAGTNITLNGDQLDVDDAFVLNTGDVITGNLDFSDGSGDSPKSIFTPQTGTVWSIYAEDTGDDLQIEVNTASTETLDIVNIGAGTINLNVDGTITASNFSGTSSGTNTGDEALSTSSAGIDVADHVIDLDVTPSSGSATLEQSEDALQVKYDSEAFSEGASGLTIAAGGIDGGAGGDIADGSITVDDLANAAVTNAKLANMAQNTIKMRVASGSGAPEDIDISSGLSLVTAAAGDFVIIEDATDGNLKRVDVSDFLGGGVAWDAISDPSASADIAFGETAQSLSGNTNNVTALAQDLLTLNYTNDGATDVLTQRILVINKLAASTNALERGLVIDNQDDNALDVALEILGSSTGAVTTAIKLDDAEIGTALALGANDVTVGGATISSAEFAALDDGIALTTETSGNYVASVATSSPLAGGAAGSEGAALTLSLNANGITAAYLDETDNYDFTGTVLFDGDALRIDDTDASHQLIITPGSNLSANRVFTLITGDAARTLTLSGDATINNTNTGDVTLAGENYLSISNQQITANAVNLSGTHVTGTLAAARFPALTGHVTTTAGNLATTIANNVVTAAMIANGDHGAFTYTGNVAALDASSVSGGVGGIITDGSITADDLGTNSVGADELQADALLWNEIGDPGGNGVIAFNETVQTLDWNTAATAAAFDGISFTITNDASTDADIQRLVVIEREASAGTATVEALLQINNNDTDGAVTKAIEITSAAGLITTALDVSDAEIGTALAIGSNDITTGATTISSAELDRLDGLTGTIVTDATAVMDIDGAGLTISGATLNIGAGTAITVNANDVAVTADGIGPTQLDETAAYAWSGANTVTGSMQFDGDALRILDTGADHYLTITPGTNLTVNRVLTITTGDAARTLTFAGDATISGTNSGDVTLAGENYLSLSSQQITANAVNLSGTHVTGTLAAARFPALTGDVTTTAGNLATTIGSDKILESMLKAVDTPTDEDILTYESTTGDFEWHTPAELSLVQTSRTITIAGTSNEITSSAGAQDLSANRTWTLSLPATIDLGGKTSFEVPNSSAPTVDAVGEIAVDDNAWAASRGTLVIYDGTAETRAVNVLSSDTPSNGQVPTWNTGGTITWETPSAGSGDITDVGPGYSTGAAFTDGVASTGTTMLVWEGTTVNTNELSLISPSADPGADIDITLPSATGNLLMRTGAITNGGLLLGTATDEVRALGVATNGQIPIGDGTTDPVLATITGTASEVTVTNGAGSITLSLPDVYGEFELQAGMFNPAAGDLTGATPLATDADNTNDFNVDELEFSASADNYVSATIHMPPDWDGSTAPKFKVISYSTGSHASNTAALNIATGYIRPGTDSWRAALGSDVEVTQTYTAADVWQLSSALAPTPAGTAAAGAQLKIRFFRQGTDVTNDTFASTTRLVKIIMQYKKTIYGNTTSW